MGYYARRFIFLTICIIQIITVALRQVFDFLGFLWIPILVNLFEIIALILGFFGGYQVRTKYLIGFIIWQLLWISWNIFIICLYLDIGTLDHQTNIVIKLDQKSESWWKSEGPQCRIKKRFQKSNDTETIQEVENCLLDYIQVEIFQSGLQCIISVLNILFAIYLIRAIKNRDSNFSHADHIRKSQRTLYSIEFSPPLDTFGSYGNENHISPALPAKPMTPRKVKRRNVMARGSSSYSSGKKSNSARSSLRKKQHNPVTQLMEQQSEFVSFGTQRRSERTSLYSNSSVNTLGRYGHSNLTYQQSSIQSLNETENMDDLYNERPCSVRSSYSNFHGTRDFNSVVLPKTYYNYSHATPQVPQKKARSSMRSRTFPNNGPPAYTSQMSVTNDTETAM